MDMHTLQQQLTADILTALELFKFARPKTPNTEITDAYANAATDAVFRHLSAVGWMQSKGEGKWPRDIQMGPAELEEVLRSTLRYPLLMARKPPQRKMELPTYLPRLAEAVTKHILMSAWALAPGLVIVKLPPRERH